MPTTTASRRHSCERLGDAELRRQAEYFADAFITRHLLDAIPGVLLVLNRQRQIVYANRALLELIGAGNENEVRGLRPGEALLCLHAGRTPEGCGSTPHCRACGMLEALLASLDGSRTVQECRVSHRRGDQVEALDLRVWANPLTYRDEQFIIFSLTDISHEKRRQALERIFFHDILNLAGGMRGFTEVLGEVPPERIALVTGRIRQTAERIIDEIQGQRILAEAESHRLRPQPEGVETLSLLGQLCEIYRVHEAGQGRQLKLAPQAEAALLVTDPTLLGRVLSNMIKNALEAAEKGQTITVDCQKVADAVEFRVHNPGVIPEPVRLQIFQRSFSTRGVGRGLGTYSMRLLSEEYLGGRVTFQSTPEAGTTFCARYPRHWAGS